MHSFRIILVVLWVTLSLYTCFVIMNQGLNLLPIFFGDILKLGWPGQFNLDFLCLLILSALWVAWRHNFSPGGLGLAVLALIGGASFLTVYLFVLSFQKKGNVRAMLLGKRE
ncbi:MAG: hypothetical protein SFY68_13140 [Candidatus Sumerlaeia bacterium]|nr:hypothetical protein [Candidatus Sumerlaeia bacterium]